MPQCPQCTRDFDELPRQCPSCKTNLDLLVEYVGELQNGLQVAEHLTRSGELGPAVWAYLSVLEVDPDNPLARRQVGQVATAVRSFDRTAPGRRWIGGLRGESGNSNGSSTGVFWLQVFGLVLLVIVTFLLGFFVGRVDWQSQPTQGDNEGPPILKPKDEGLMLPQ